jgi:hypothetical protein
MRRAKAAPCWISAYLYSVRPVPEPWDVPGSVQRRRRLTFLRLADHLRGRYVHRGWWVSYWEPSLLAVPPVGTGCCILRIRGRYLGGGLGREWEK